jgi:hypothetical protein
MDLSGSAVEAVVAGRLEFEQDGEGAWHARVILDV